MTGRVSNRAERLALLRETGHIEFDLLIYIFEEGEEYYSEGPYGEVSPPIKVENSPLIRTT